MNTARATSLVIPLLLWTQAHVNGQSPEGLTSIVIYEDQLPAGSSLLPGTQESTSDPLSGATGLEYLVSGSGRQTMGITDLAIDPSTLVPWENFYLEFAVKVEGASASHYAEAKLHVLPGNDHLRGRLRISAGSGWQIIQIPLTRFELPSGGIYATQVDFGDTLRQFTLEINGGSEPWAVGTAVRVDEVRIVQGNQRADLVIFSESVPYDGQVGSQTARSTTNPFSGLSHLAPRSADPPTVPEKDPDGAGGPLAGRSWVNLAINDFTPGILSTEALRTAWTTAGLTFALYLPPTHPDDRGFLDDASVSIFTDQAGTARRWVYSLGSRNPRTVGAYQMVAIRLSEFEDQASPGMRPDPTTFGDSITEVRIGARFPEGTAVDEIRFTTVFNEVPVVQPIVVTPEPTAEIGQPVQFESSATDSDGGVAEYAWDFGDGSPTQRGPNLTSISHIFMQAGVYRVTVTATDGGGAFGAAGVDVEITCPSATPVLTAETVTFSGRVLDPAVSTILVGGQSTPVTGGAYSVTLPLSSGTMAVTFEKSPGDGVRYSLEIARLP